MRVTTVVKSPVERSRKRPATVAAARSELLQGPPGATFQSVGPDWPPVTRAIVYGRPHVRWNGNCTSDVLDWPVSDLRVSESSPERVC